MTKTVAIIQARMSSTRLPGKILLQLGDKTILSHVVYRLKRCKILDDVIVATTTLVDDNATVEECRHTATKYFRGSCDNVLQRYYLAAAQAKADVVIRVTSDCPFIDPAMLDKMVAEFKKAKVDYLSNTIERNFPRGFDIEIFTFNALERAYQEASASHEQEHVTPHIYLNHDKFSLAYYKDDNDNSDLRVTLDTPEDWQVIKHIYNALGENNSDFSYRDVIGYLRNNPAIAQINSHIEQKKLGE